jgi:hypothetical protein
MRKAVSKQFPVRQIRLPATASRRIYRHYNFRASSAVWKWSASDGFALSPSAYRSADFHTLSSRSIAPPDLSDWRTRSCVNALTNATLPLCRLLRDNGHFIANRIHATRELAMPPTCTAHNFYQIVSLHCAQSSIANISATTHRRGSRMAPVDSSRRRQSNGVVGGRPFWKA